jgi:hypothetical protein
MTKTKKNIFLLDCVPRNRLRWLRARLIKKKNDRHHFHLQARAERVVEVEFPGVAGYRRYFAAKAQLQYSR